MEEGSWLRLKGSGGDVGRRQNASSKAFQRECSTVVVMVTPPDLELNALQNFDTRADVGREFEGNNPGCPSGCFSIGVDGVPRPLQGYQLREFTIDQQFVELAAAQHCGTVVVLEAARVSHGGGKCRERARYDHRHDCGRNKEFEKGKSQLRGFWTPDHCCGRSSICAAPDVGSMRTIRCLPRVFAISIPIAGIAPAG